ncbi:cobyric acid synthase [Labrys miyagiensis]
MPAKILMLQGTGSDVGKSLLVAGLCRYFSDRGLRVRPFKPQNMSNNAAVTADGGEIGRAQALQARAARVAPSVHMNPVLLKPQSETGAQIIVQGRMRGAAKARDYQALKAGLMTDVIDSFGRLRDEADIVIVEGAGSASEVNLRANDIANMGFARAVEAPVILVGDIDRGGVIAQLLGTQAAVEPEDAALVRGFIVNKMRGDPSLFADGMRFIAGRTKWQPLGLVPHFPDAAKLPAEDALALGSYGSRRPGARTTITVPMMPRISNFDDLDPLAQEKEVDLVMVRPGEPLPPTDLVILPGSKATIADLAFLREQGWDIDLAAHVRRGGRVLGLCGGYQMLGMRIEDPDGIEGPPAEVPGLGLLDVATRLAGDKRLVAVSGMTVADGVAFAGYEMHVGITEGTALGRPVLRLADGSLDGAWSADGRVAGCYVHGLFGHDGQRAAWLRRLGGQGSDMRYDMVVEDTLDAFAAHLAAHLDMQAIERIAGI